MIDLGSAAAFGPLLVLLIVDLLIHMPWLHSISLLFVNVSLGSNKAPNSLYKPLSPKLEQDRREHSKVMIDLRSVIVFGR